MNEYGVTVAYTNDKTVLKTDQTVKTAFTELVTLQPELSHYEVVSSQTKDYVQHQEQILIMTNGVKKVQVTGHIDHKTLRYEPLEQKEVPVEVTYPVISQNTIPSEVFSTVVKKHKPLAVSQDLLLQKFKIFKHKVPTLTTVEHFGKVEVYNFQYEVGHKKFVAVVQIDK